MTTREIRVRGLNEVEQKLDEAYLLQPELDAALETFAKRMQRGGKGLGARRNTVSANVQSFGAEAVSSLNNPRTTGGAWGAKNQRILSNMAPRVFRKMTQRIEERWAAEQASSQSPGDYSGLDG